ncbi:serine/threonine-protein kinase [Nocardia sp. NBC_00403]
MPESRCRTWEEPKVVGELFGRYTLQAMLGEGGMGQVYRAHDSATDRTVAVKVLHTHLAADPVVRQRFQREARAAASLGHPHVVPIFDFGEIEGRPFICMQFIEGAGVDAVLAESGPMPLARAVSIIAQASEALDAAHAKGLVHRDVKPSNLLVTAGDFVYLIDFGIARAAAETTMTTAGTAIGTFAYMAPERFSAGTADARSDVYALTCVLYQCLTGQNPYPATSAEQQIAAHLTQPPPRPSLLRPDIGVTLDHVIATGLAKDPDSRYQTAAEFAAATVAAATTVFHPAETQVNPASATVDPQSALTTPLRSSPSSKRTGSYGGTLRRRRGLALGIAAAVVLAAAISIGVLGTTGSRSDARSTPAPTTTVPAVPTIAVGGKPRSIAIDGPAHTAYIVNDDDSNTVSVIDTETQTLAATLVIAPPFRQDFNATPNKQQPTGVAVDTLTHTAYVISFFGTVSIVDTASRSITATAHVPGYLFGIGVDAAARIAYITDRSADGKVSVMDLTTRTVTATIPVGKDPASVAVDESTHIAYVTNTGDNSVSVIDGVAKAVTATFGVPSSPEAIAVDSDAHAVYVVNDKKVSVVNAETRAITAAIAVDFSLDRIAVDPVKHCLYVGTSETVMVVDTGTRKVTDVLPYKGLGGVAVDPITHALFAADYGVGNSKVSVIAR